MYSLYVFLPQLTLQQCVYKGFERFWQFLKGTISWDVQLHVFHQIASSHPISGTLGRFFFFPNFMEILALKMDSQVNICIIRELQLPMRCTLRSWLSTVGKVWNILSVCVTGELTLYMLQHKLGITLTLFLKNPFFWSTDRWFFFMGYLPKVNYCSCTVRVCYNEK